MTEIVATIAHKMKVIIQTFECLILLMIYDIIG